MALKEKIHHAWTSLNREQRWFMGWILAAMTGLAWLATPGPRAAKAAVKLATAHAAGQPAGTADYVAYWIPKAALGGLVVAALMLLCTRWLTVPVPAGGPEIPRPDKRYGRLLILVTAGLIAFNAFANAPRLNFGFWGDEESTMRKSVVGQFERGKSGNLEFDGVSWQETFFRYRDPNNHPLNSVLSRLSHEAFADDLTRPEGFYFDERAMRYPVFAAGLLGLAAVAWLGWILGRPALGVMAVLLLTVHPWMVRYSVETRGYGFLLLFTPLALACLVKSITTARWRWWTGYGISQFLILWSYPGSVDLLTALNVAALCAVWLTRGPSREWRRSQTARWLTACLLGAVLSTLLLAPCVQPLLFYLNTPRMRGPMPAEWYPEATAWLISGLPWTAWDASNPLCWSWRQAFAAHPVLTGLTLTVFGGALAGGAWGWWRQGGIVRALLPALILHTPLFLLQSRLTGNFLYSWYLLPSLTGIALLLAGVTLLPRPVHLILPAALFGLFTWITWPAVQALRQHPTEQMREGTKLTRAVSLASDPRIDDVITVDIIMTTRGYDPAVLPLPEDDPARFKALLTKADAAGKPLFVHFGSPAFADAVRPQVMAIIRNPAIFEEIATLPGQDAPYTRQVFRYRPGSVPQ